MRRCAIDRDVAWGRHIPGTRAPKRATPVQRRGVQHEVVSRKLAEVEAAAFGNLVFRGGEPNGAGSTIRAVQNMAQRAPKSRQAIHFRFQRFLGTVSEPGLGSHVTRLHADFTNRLNVQGIAWGIEKIAET